MNIIAGGVCQGTRCCKWKNNFHGLAFACDPGRGGGAGELCGGLGSSCCSCKMGTLKHTWSMLVFLCGGEPVGKRRGDGQCSCLVGCLTLSCVFAVSSIWWFGCWEDLGAAAAWAGGGKWGRYGWSDFWTFWDPFLPRTLQNSLFSLHGQAQFIFKLSGYTWLVWGQIALGNALLLKTKLESSCCFSPQFIFTIAVKIIAVLAKINSWV